LKTVISRIGIDANAVRGSAFSARASPAARKIMMPAIIIFMIFFLRKSFAAIRISGPLGESGSG
jgi:hypothetical protein